MIEYRRTIAQRFWGALRSDDPPPWAVLLAWAFAESALLALLWAGHVALG